jgi:Fe-Mn family superoxide dismutase
MAAYELPDLPYDYGALAPHISGEIMELHHSKHHATYVKGLNTALEKLEEARETESFDSVVGLEESCLQPRRSHQPLGVLAEHVTRRRRQASR